MTTPTILYDPGICRVVRVLGRRDVYGQDAYLATSGHVFVDQAVVGDDIPDWAWAEFDNAEAEDYADWRESRQREAAVQ